MGVDPSLLVGFCLNRGGWQALASLGLAPLVLEHAEAIIGQDRAELEETA